MFQHFRPVQPRHIEIKEKKRRLSLLNYLECLGTILAFSALVTGGHQQVRQNFAARGIIIYDQNFGMGVVRHLLFGFGSRPLHHRIDIDLRQRNAG